MLETWVFTVAAPMNNASEISAFVEPFASSIRTSRSRSVSVSSRRGRRRAGGEGLGEPSDQAAGDRRVEQGPAVGDGADRRSELLGWDVLEDEPARPGPQGAIDVLVGVERGEDDHLERPIRFAEDPAGRGEAVELGHANVHEDDVGTVTACDLDGFEAGAGFGDHVDVGLLAQHHREAAADEGLIVDDGDAEGHVGSVSSGRRA